MLGLLSHLQGSVIKPIKGRLDSKTTSIFLTSYTKGYIESQLLGSNRSRKTATADIDVNVLE
jgi:hypothetical protein